MDTFKAKAILVRKILLAAGMLFAGWMLVLSAIVVALACNVAVAWAFWALASVAFGLAQPTIQQAIAAGLMLTLFILVTRPMWAGK